MATSVERVLQWAIKRLAGVSQCLDRRLASAKLARPRMDAHGAAVERDGLSAGRVLALFEHRRPLAVSRLVVALVVDALKGVAFGWARPHVCQELREGLSPRTTDLNSTASISRVVLAACVFAARDHAFPDAILGSLAKTVRPSLKASAFCIEAPAALNVAALERSGRDDCGRYQPGIVSAAVTGAKPVNLVVARPERPNNRKPSELLTGEVYA